VTEPTLQRSKSSDAIVERLARLAEWSASVGSVDIPDAVYRQAAIVLCDDLAAIISARNDPILSQVHKHLLSDGGRPVATVFRGGRPRTDRYSAAAANGAAGPWNELDEGSLRVSCHAGIYVLPALLAEAEAEGLSTREVLRCLVVAYEVVTRLALAFPQPSLLLHPHAFLSVVGATAATATARHFGGMLYFSALTMSAAFVNPGPFDHAVHGSFVRNMWTAHGAWAGMRAADWATCGISGLPEGPHRIFHDVLGFDCDPDSLVFELGQDWLINHNFQKVYPCCQYAHSMVEAIESVIASLPDGIELRNCDELVVEIHQRGQLLNEVNPETILAARFSVPHIAAVAAVYGRLDSETLSPESLKDSAVVDLRQRVLVRPFEPVMSPPNDRPARVRFKFTGGMQYQAECLCARGSPSRPFSFEEIRQKVDRICASVYPDLASVMDRLVNLEDGLLDSPWEETISQLTGGARVVRGE